MNSKLKYLDLIRQNCTRYGQTEHDLEYWRNKLFCTTLMYVLPLSLIALVPGLYWTIKIKEYFVAIADIIVVCSLFVVAFVPGISLGIRKIVFISSAYLFSIALLYFVGMSGFGLTYLLSSCIFSILIFSKGSIYWPAWLNTGICLIFGLLVWLEMLPPGDPRNANPAEWLAISSNLIFLSFLCAALIPRLFMGLQQTIKKEIELKKELESDKKDLGELSNRLSRALEDNMKVLNSSLDVICTVNRNFEFVMVSAACKEVWGYSPEELVGKSTLDLVYPEDRLKTISNAESVIGGVPVSNFENRFIHKDGSLVPMSWSSRWDEQEGIRYSGGRSIKEKKALEQHALEEQQRFFELFLEAPMSMGISRGPEHIYEAVNPPYLKLVGKNDIIGRPVREVLYGTGGETIVKILDKVYLTGETFIASEMLLEVDSDDEIHDLYLNFTCQAHKSKTGEIDGVLFFVIDVTEQVISRKKIEISEMRLNAAQAIAMIGNWEKDLIKGTQYWSDGLYELFGVTQTDVSPSEESFLSFVHPDDRAYVLSEMGRRLEAMQSSTFECRFIRKDGALRYGYNEWKVKFDTEGNAEMLSGILQDVTERKENEQNLKDSEVFNRGVIDALTSNMAVIDFAGNLVAVNEIWKAYGQQHGEHTLQGTSLGSNYFTVCEQAHRDGVPYAQAAMDGIKEVMHDENEVFYLEYVNHTPSNEGWFSMRVMKFEGKEPYLVIVHHNISERKFAEAERSRAAQDLISRNKDLEQFTYIVSHNLRAPVANITGLVEIWRSTSLNEEEKESVSLALYNSVVKLDEVVKDLNQILQVRGQLNERNEEVEFSSLVKNIKLSIKTIIDTDHIQIHYDFSEIDHFMSIKSYLYSIFYNLITNSIKYRQHHIPCNINISSHLSGNKLELRFSDNSLGIDLAKRGDQVFGLYKRFHSHVAGKGLGLFMVKTQVENLGGKISVTSEVNKGTEFRIEFENVGSSLRSE